MMWIEKMLFAWLKPQKPRVFMVSGVGNQMVLSWVKGERTTGIQIVRFDRKKNKYQHMKNTKRHNYVFKGIRGETSIFKIRAYRMYHGKIYYSGFSMPKKVTLSSNGESTIRNCLKTAIVPVGTTMYIWGGGWNQDDTAAGESAKQIGVSETWYKFFKEQDANYDYTNYGNQLEKGLDCSGFVGWIIYNIRNTKAGNSGYVMAAKDMGKTFASKEWGVYKDKGEVIDYKAGDVMTSSNHVYIVIGSCLDGSVVLVHSSPAGVRLCGTVTPQGKKGSKAVSLAKKYMKKYHNAWYKKYPSCHKNIRYLKDYGQMRWDVSGNKIMIDDENYWNHDAKWILKDLYTN